MLQANSKLKRHGAGRRDMDSLRPRFQRFRDTNSHRVVSFTQPIQKVHHTELLRLLILKNYKNYKIFKKIPAQYDALAR